MRMLHCQSYFAEMPFVFEWADAIICLSETDKAFWGRFNSNVHMISNPHSFTDIARQASSLDSWNILWVGRLDEEKRPEDAIRIFSIVHDALPQAKLTILGKDECGGKYLAYLEELSATLKLDNCIEFAGYVDDVSPYYRQADLFLSTSAFEGFYLALYDAMSFGVPAVMYELPYLAIAKNNDSICSVAQENLQDAARQTIRLLNDRAELKKRGELALAYFDKLASFDYASAWSDIFSSLTRAKSKPLADPAERLMWKTLLEHYSLGVKKHCIQDHKKQRKEETDEVKRVKASNSYKVGRVMTWPVRKARRAAKALKNRLPLSKAR